MTEAPIYATRANVLFQDVHLSPMMNAYNWYGTWGIFGLTMRIFREFWGGLWVGGVFELFATQVEFHPNELNKAFSNGSLNINISLENVDKVGWRRGFLSNIIDVYQGPIRTSFRCSGARELARTIQDAVERIHGGSLAKESA